MKEGKKIQNRKRRNLWRGTLHQLLVTALFSMASLYILVRLFFFLLFFFRGVTQLRASTIHYPDWRADEEPANFTTRNLFGGEFHLKQKKK